MKKSRLNDSQIMDAQKRTESEVRLLDLYPALGISGAPFIVGKTCAVCSSRRETHLSIDGI